ncbi:MAG TPA: hypothetical protein VGB96_01810, partial [Archangium sp.]
MAALMVLPTASSAQKGLPVDDRIRLLETMNQCWQTSRKQSLETSGNGSADAQADGVFKKLISGKVSLAGGAGFKQQMQVEFAPLAGDAVTAAKIEACFRMASGGESLNLTPAPAPAPAPVPASKPTPQNPKKAAHISPNPSPPPDWTCREPAVFLSASCDKGGLTEMADNVLVREGVVRGWSREEQGYSTRCAHKEPSEGAVKTRSSCEAKEGTVRLALTNRFEGKGGKSEQQSCSRQERCLTYLAFRVDEGGAEVRIPPEAAGRYDLQVDSLECSDKPSMGEKRVALDATILGNKHSLESGKRFHLKRAGLVVLRLLGHIKFE